MLFDGVGLKVCLMRGINRKVIIITNQTSTIAQREIVCAYLMQDPPMERHALQKRDTQ